MATRVLLVDPQHLVREGIRLLIESRPGYEVVAQVADGRRAVDLAVRWKPELIVSEALLPRLSGVDATREIVKQGLPSRVLILSSLDRQSVVQAALEAGARGYVLKKSPPAELIEALQSLSAGRSYLSPGVTQHVVEALTRSRQPSGSGLAQLTSREREVLQLIAEGLSSKEIGSTLGVSLRTVESYRASLMEKLGIHKVSALVRFAIREGIVEA